MNASINCRSTCNMVADIRELLAIYTNKAVTRRLIRYYNNIDYISTRFKYGQDIIWDNRRYESYYDKYIYSIYVSDRLYQQFERNSRSISYSSRNLLVVSTYYSDKLRIHIYESKGMIYVEYRDSYIFYRDGDISYITIRDDSYCIVKFGKREFMIEVSYSANKCLKLREKCNNRINNII